ncbi:MAG: hypothetical protein AAGF68_07345 [Pseudomonadota bacterium]
MEHWPQYSAYPKARLMSLDGVSAQDIDILDSPRSIGWKRNDPYNALVLFHPLGDPKRYPKRWQIRGTGCDDNHDNLYFVGACERFVTRVAENIRLGDMKALEAS